MVNLQFRSPALLVIGTIFICMFYPSIYSLQTITYFQIYLQYVYKDINKYS